MIMTYSGIILVEGTDDAHVIAHICYKAGLGFPYILADQNDYEKRDENPNDFAIKNPKSEGGYPRLKESIEFEFSSPNKCDFIGIVADANDSPKSRWRSICDELQKSNVANTPTEPVDQGAVFQGVNAKQKIGIWLMPDNLSSGELEDFVKTMIPRDDKIWEHAEKYIDGVVEDKLIDSPPVKQTKAKVSAWLAAQERLGPMGVSIKKGNLAIDGPQCFKFIEWLNRLIVVN